MNQASAPASSRRLPWDWFPGTIPDNVEVDPSAYLETTFCFCLYRSAAPVGVRIGRGASAYQGTMFDVGERGVVSVGEFALLHSARIICDQSIEIGDHTLISWNVVLMDTYRAPRDRLARRRLLQKAAETHALTEASPARPIRIGANVWLGFDVCVMPGVTIGEGAVIGARSAVFDDIPPYSVAVGNPARVIRRLDSPASLAADETRSEM